jgi:outer membrane immunogenic protein
MRMVLFAGLATLAFAAPAMAQSANEAAPLTGARADVHGGLGWADGQQVQGTLGATLGYDIATGGRTFVGVEQSADKVLTSNDKLRWTTAARAGLALSPRDKAYVLAGYTYGAGPDGTQIGGGLERSYGKAYTKVEYRHTFNQDGAKDSNAALVGVGVHF